MKCRPLLFSAPMVRAFLAGRKSQTRRVIKPQPAGDWAVPGRSMCPHGIPGDRIWVRETWANIALAGYTPVYFYRADGEGLPPRDDRATHSTWRPSIFMPREASRITLEISQIRVERLNDISEADAAAEGIEPIGEAWRSYEIIHIGPHKGKPNPHSRVPNRSPVTSYRELWESLNGPESWTANPWVWVIQFARIETMARS